MQSANGEQRLFLARDKFPQLLVDTLIATEDRRFMSMMASVFILLVVRC